MAVEMHSHLHIRLSTTAQCKHKRLTKSAGGINALDQNMYSSGVNKLTSCQQFSLILTYFENAF